MLATPRTSKNIVGGVFCAQVSERKYAIILRSHLTSFCEIVLNIYFLWIQMMWMSDQPLRVDIL